MTPVTSFKFWCIELTFRRHLLRVSARESVILMIFSLFPIFPHVKWNNILKYVMNTFKSFPLAHFTIYNYLFIYFNTDNCAIERASLIHLSVLSKCLIHTTFWESDQLLSSWNKTLCISFIPQIVDNVRHNILIMILPLSESFRETSQ
jgi:hypothetical protein